MLVYVLSATLLSLFAIMTYAENVSSIALNIVLAALAFSVSWVIRSNLVGAPITNGEGEVEGEIAAIHGTSERNRAEIALRESEEQFRDLFESVNDLIQSVGPNGNYVYVNKAWRDVLGYGPDDIPNLNMSDVIAPEYLDHSQQIMQSAGQTGKSTVLETVFLSKSGKPVYVEGNISAKIEGGQIIATRGIFRNITVRKQTERKLEKTQERLNSVYNNAGAGIAIIEFPDRILNHNSAFAHMFGYATGQLPNTHFWNLVHENDIEAGRKVLAKALAKSGSTDGERYEARGIHVNGSVIWLLISFSAFPTDDGHEPQIITVLQDLTHQKQTEDALRIARDEAERASRAKSAFLANMSHELRTPLNAIIGFAQILEQDQSLPATTHNSIKIMHKSGENLRTMIDDLLDMARIEAGYAVLDITTFSLFQMIDQIEAQYKQLASKKHLWLRFDLAENVPQYVQTDEEKLHQVLDNLISNAVKYTETGGATIHVQHDTDDEELRLHFTVADTGPGLPKQYQQDFFSRLAQNEDNASSSRPSLGLALSQQLVGLMGGILQVEASPERGTVFSFSIPIEIGRKSDLTETQEQLEGVTGLTKDQSVPRILVVEDRIETRLLITTMLGSVGFDLREASDGRAALQAVQSWEPDLILMDIHMPVMDGVAATTQIRELGKPQLKVVAMVSSPREQNELLASGLFDAYLMKPIQREQLLGQLSQHLAITYDHADALDSTPIEFDDESDESLQPMLKRTDQKWRTELYDYALMADIQQIQEHLAIIEPNEPKLYNYLKRISHNYEFGKILDLIESGRNDPHG